MIDQFPTLRIEHPDSVNVKKDGQPTGLQDAARNSPRYSYLRSVAATTLYSRVVPKPARHAVATSSPDDDLPYATKKL